MISDPLSVTENYPLRQSNYLILHIPRVQSQILPTGSSIAKLSDYLLLIAVSRQTGGTDIWLEEWLHFFFFFHCFGCLLLTAALWSLKNVVKSEGVREKKNLQTAASVGRNIVTPSISRCFYARQLSSGVAKSLKLFWTKHGKMC